MGFGLTPLALAAAPVATEAKVPEIVTAAATAMITEKSPFIVRTSFTLPQASAPMAQWALKNDIKKVVTIVTDYGPGIDAEKWFGETFKDGGGKIVEAIRVPLKNPDFAPFLQRVKDDKPDAVFVFVPSGFGAVFMKQFVERGLDKAGIKLIGTGDVTDDDLLADIGDSALGAVTTHHYSAAHDSPENKAFVAAFEKANGFRPNFMAVGAYDGMALVYHALETTKGATDGAALLAAMKGAKWMSPRGRSRSIPTRATSCRTSMCARSRRRTASSTTSSSRRSRREGPVQGVEEVEPSDAPLPRLRGRAGVGASPALPS